MTSAKDNGSSPAFPMYSQNNYSIQIAGGLTKREWLAGMILSHSQTIDSAGAIVLADKLLKALAETPQTDSL